MRRRPTAAWDVKPKKAIFYGLVARLADRWAGAKDGRAAMPSVPAGSSAADASRPAVTPYLEIRNRHFQDRAKREHLHYEHDTADVAQQLQALREQIVGADEAAADISKQLAELPETPDSDVLTRRNAVEQHADEALIRSRRKREYDVERGKLLTQERHAIQAARALRVEEASLSESVAARHRVMDRRVEQLHEHTLRRCGTYKRRLAHKHPAGAEVIPHLDLALPQLPSWVSR